MSRSEGSPVSKMVTSVNHLSTGSNSYRDESAGAIGNLFDHEERWRLIV